MVTAMIMAGTGNDPKAREFFDGALKRQLSQSLKDGAHMSHQQRGSA
jgi:hypothetical protein